jgi:hypothetical protein
MIIKIILALRISVRGNGHPSLADGYTRHYIYTYYLLSKITITVNFK